jgi:hypothetical protein
MNTSHSDSNPDLYIRQPAAPLRNHKENVKPIIPTDLKIALIIGALLAATVITFACLTGNGTLSVPDWAAKTLEGVAYGIGSLQLLSLPFLIRYYFRTKQQLERRERMLDAAQPEPSQLSPPPPPITQQEWDHRKANEAKKLRGFINLDKPGQACPDSAISISSSIDCQLPLFGHYGHDIGFGHMEEMAVSLPSSQLRAFPEQLQKQFASESLSHQAECYFIVFNNTRLVKEIAEKTEVNENKKEVRTIALHPIIFADYDKTQPSHVSEMAAKLGVEPFHGAGIQVPVSMAMYSPRGIQSTHNGKLGIPIDEKPKQFTLSAHGRPNQPPLISPQHAEFKITKGPAVSSVYMGATWGKGEHKRGIAIHAVFLNDNDPDLKQGQILENALKKTNVNDFLQSLEQDKFILLEDVAKTFTLQNPAQTF